MRYRYHSVAGVHDKRLGQLNVVRSSGRRIPGVTNTQVTLETRYDGLVKYLTHKTYATVYIEMVVRTTARYNACSLLAAVLKSNQSQADDIGNAQIGWPLAIGDATEQSALFDQ